LVELHNVFTGRLLPDEEANGKQTAASSSLLGEEINCPHPFPYFVHLYTLAL